MLAKQRNRLQMSNDAKNFLNEIDDYQDFTTNIIIDKSVEREKKPIQRRGSDEPPQAYMPVPQTTYQPKFGNEL